MATASMQDTKVKVESNTPSQIRAILLADGNWHKPVNCELIQYAIGEAHSPVTPSKLYSYLKFTEDGREYKVSFDKVMAFQTE